MDLEHKLIDGRKLSMHLLDSVRTDWQVRVDKKTTPKLVIIQIGDQHASTIYINRKIQACRRVGFHPALISLPVSTTQNEVIYHIEQLNNDPSVTGILLQLPLPPQLSAASLLAIIHPDKDVDGIGPTNLGRLVSGNFDTPPCTTGAILYCLRSIRTPLSGTHVVMVGSSPLVGKPTAIALLHHHATVTVCHSKTQDLAQQVRQADILIVAIGNPNVIQPDWIHPGCIVIDVGINRGVDGRIIGDIPASSVIDKVSFITPVPGGVGPLTVAHLIKNLYTLYCNQSKPLSKRD